MPFGICKNKVQMMRLVDSVFSQFHILDGGSHLFRCPSYVIGPSWQTPVRPSIFRQQYLSPKPLGGISPFVTGLIDPLFVKNVHFIKKNNLVQMVLGASLGHPLIILIGLKI